MYSHETISFLFAIGITLLQIDLLILIGMYLFAPEGKWMKMVNKHSLKIVAFISFLSIAGSLTYSELLQFTPCKLCWFQRIFLYPTFFIGVVASIVRDPKALRYTLVLSSVGILFSAYHYFLQMSGIEGLPCAVVGQTNSCGGVFVKEFGYITIPFMALTLNLYVIVASWIGLKLQKNQNI